MSVIEGLAPLSTIINHSPIAVLKLALTITTCTYINLLRVHRVGRPINIFRAAELMELSSAQDYGQSYQGLMALAMFYKEGFFGTKPRWGEALRLMELAVKGGRLGATGNEDLHNFLEEIRECSPLLRQRVVIQSSKGEFDGACGIAIDFGYNSRTEGAECVSEWLIDTGRYTVKLDAPEGRLVRVLAKNVKKDAGDALGQKLRHKNVP